MDAQPTPIVPTVPAQTPGLKPSGVKGSLLVIMAACLLVATALAGLFYFQIQKLSKELSKYQTQPTPLVSPEPSAEAETTNWKTYTNDEYRIEIKYYPESTPYKLVGNTETGQFTYLYQVNFGMNPLKSISGYSLVIRQKQTIENYRTELIGHITDKIDSEEDTTINGNTWKKINYQMFLTTDYVPMTIAYINHSKYDFVVTASALDIDQILSTFKFLDQNSQTSSCTPKFEVESGPELTASEVYSQKCYEAKTKEECEKVDIYRESTQNFGNSDGIPDCSWTESK